VRVVKAFNREGYEAGRYDQQMERAFSATMALTESARHLAADHFMASARWRHPVVRRARGAGRRLSAGA
jgi:hypothetical protein